MKNKKIFCRKLFSVGVSAVFVLGVTVSSSFAAKIISRSDIQSSELNQNQWTTVAKSASKDIVQLAKTAKQCTDLVDKILNLADKLTYKGGTQYMTNWMKQAKEEINKKLNSTETVAQKQAWLNKALTSLQAIENTKNNDVLITLAEQTLSKGGAFATRNMEVTIAKNITYNIVKNFDRTGVILINNLAKETGMSKVDIFKLFQGTAFDKKSVAATGGSTKVLQQQIESGKYFADDLNVVLMAKKAMNLTNQLANKGESQYVRNWMNQAKEEISKKLNSNETVTQKQEWLKKALTSLQAVENTKNNDVLITLAEQTLSKDGVFTSRAMNDTIAKNITFNIMREFGKTGVTLINNLAKETGKSKTEIYKVIATSSATFEDIVATKGSTAVFKQQIKDGLYGSASGAKLEKIFKK